MKNEILNTIVKKGQYTLFTVFFAVLGLINLYGQDYPHLEKLVKDSEEMKFPIASENGRWIAWNIVLSDRSKNVMMQSVKESDKKFEWKNINSVAFAKNLLVLQTGSDLELFNPETGKSVTEKNVSKYLYDQQNEVLLVLYNEKAGKRLEVLDQNLKVKQAVEDVQNVFSSNHETVAKKKIGDMNVVLALKNGFLETIFSTGDDVREIIPSGMRQKGFVAVSKTKERTTVTYIDQSGNQYTLDVSAYGEYDQLTLIPSPDEQRVVLKFQKRIKAKTDMVNIWYGTEVDLHKYNSFVMEYRQIDWNPFNGDKVEMTRDGYFGETAIGNSLYLMKAVDLEQVDIMDQYSGKSLDRLYLYNALDNKYTFITEIGKQMVISPTGKFLVIQKDNNWQLYNTRSLTIEDLNARSEMIPYFTSDEKLIWVGGSWISEQNLNTKKMTELHVAPGADIELIDFERVHADIGNKQDYRKADLTKSLVVKITDRNSQNVSYAYLKNKKLYTILPSTADGITEFKKLGSKEDYFWVQENYNKRPRVVAKTGKGVPKVVYISDPKNVKYENMELIKFSYKGSDGENIEGNLYMPLNYDRSKKYPVITFVYEKLGYFTKSFRRPSFSHPIGFSIPLLVEEGFAVLLADISQSDKGAGISALESVNNALDQLQKVKNVDMKRVGLLGQSFGGYQTNFIATHSDRFAAYVSGAAVSDVIRTYYAYNYNFKAPDYYRYEGRQYWFKETVAENPDKYIRNNPIMFVQNVTAPMLLWTGTDDGNVSPEGTKSMFIGLRKYRKPVIALFYDKEKHVMGKPETQKDLTIRILDWFNYYLKDKKNIPWIQKNIKGA